MSEPGGAPAGWYPDPHVPGQLRYFDGSIWTEHRHVEGKLPDVGSWLSTTCGIVADHWKQLFLLVGGFGVLSSLITWIGVRLVIDDLAIIDEQLVNGGSREVIGGLVLAAILIFLGLWAWLAPIRYVQRAHLHASPSIAESLRWSLSRIPLMLGWMLLIGLAVMVVVLVTSLLGPIGLLVALPLVVWVGVKTAFVGQAVVCAPKGVSALRESMAVSSGRWWPTFGRLLLLLVLSVVFNVVVSLMTSSLGSPVDQQAIEDTFVTVGGETVIVDTILRDWFPLTPATFVAVIVAAILGSVIGMVGASAMTRLYLDAGGASQVKSDLVNPGQI